MKVPPYSTFAVPFRWMLRENQEEIEGALSSPLPPDEEPPFKTLVGLLAGAAERAVRSILRTDRCRTSRLSSSTPKAAIRSIESINRLIVGVGQIEWMSKLQFYDASEGPRYPLWDRLFTHSIRPDGAQGMLLPYHDYLEPTGDRDEDERRKALTRKLRSRPSARK